MNNFLRIALVTWFMGLSLLQAQESYMLEYDNVEVRAVTQDIARLQRKQSFGSKGQRKSDHIL